MQVIGSTFVGGRKAGDFGWMIEQSEYADAFFVFNDNEEQFRAHGHHAPGSHQCTAGGGNAAIRPYQCEAAPRAAGIPTGSHGTGYAQLDDHVRSVIDDALLALRARVTEGRFQRLYYSAAKGDPDDLGTGIFKVGRDVRRYIVAGLRKLESEG